jgi:hypothetical protein
MPTTQSLQNAYDRAQLARHGVTFERAMAEPMFKNCLTRLAEVIEKPYIPLPTHPSRPHWQERD